jgi:aminopeptidase YwaD
METTPTITRSIRITLQAKSALRHTSEWIARFGGRLAGSESCRKTAEVLKNEFEQICGTAELEPFLTHPRAFNGFFRIDAILYLMGLILLLLNQPLLAGLVCLFMVTAAGLQFGWYVELYDRLFPQKECYNVSAILEPKAEVHQQLIFSGHHDSAQELNFLKKNQKLYILKIVIPDTIRILALVTSWTWLGWQILSGQLPPFVPLAKVLLIFGLYFVFTKFFLVSSQSTPGAGDNLIASAMLVELAHRFTSLEKHGQSILEHTRLIFLSFDAEESGVRGSRAWVRQHKNQLKSLPTLALNIDSIYKVADLSFLTSDLNSHIPLNRPLAEMCVKIAQTSGYAASLAQMRFGGGATDAVELAKAGVQATTMIAMSSQVIRDGLVYHTMKDTVDAIQPAAVEACLAVAEGLAFEVERNPFP